MIVRQVLEADSGRRMFRDAALERLNSPELLDQRTSVIPPAMSVFVASITVIVLAVLAWAIFGSVPTRTTGRGVLLSDKEGNFAIAQVATGLVLEVFVRPGDKVEAGAAIARIEQKVLTAQIDSGTAQVERLEANLAELKVAHAAQIERSDEFARRQQAAIDEQVEAHEARRDQLRQLIVGFEGLRARGMVAQTEVLARQDQLNQSILELANAKATRLEVEATALKKRDDLAQIERQMLVEIDLKKAEVENLRVQRAVAETVRSPIAGIIREVRLGRGNVASAGEVLATVGPASADDHDVMTLLHGNTRKRVAVGMEAYVTPDGTRKEEYGSMRGRVVSVSQGDVSFDHVDQILHNAQLTKTLFGDGSPLLAQIELTPDKGNTSGFVWWNGNGPPYKITPGTVVTVDIIVAQVRPISLVIPALRELLSLKGG